MLELISAEATLYGAFRRYRHPTLGVLEVMTVHRKDGSADVVDLENALFKAMTRFRVRAGEDVWTGSLNSERVLERGSSKSRKGQTRRRPPRQPDPGLQRESRQVR